ncbi:MAG: porphobilinogen synthase [Kiritimatiellae bacterium]|nr:porphobilinogen synthase [Kiritimatiellia bacterium]
MDEHFGLRLRRLRRNAAWREMAAMPMPPPSKFIWPVFALPGEGRKEEIASLPGQFRASADELVKMLAPAVKDGIRSVLVFGVPGEDTHKDELGTPAADMHGAVPQALRAIKKAYPGVYAIADVCLCAYTSHGHCGPRDVTGDVDNDAACEMLGRVAVAYARAGADAVAPSAMMDRQVAVIRAALDEEWFVNTPVIAYSSKFASNLYGPFRDAENSAPSQGTTRAGYQADWRDAKAAVLESVLDESEGADALMVKPATFYLDIIKEVRSRTLLPLMAYHVSGEYAMLHAAAERGWCDLYPTAREALSAIFRAGADQVITYFAPFYKEIFG